MAGILQKQANDNKKWQTYRPIGLHLCHIQHDDAFCALNHVFLARLTGLWDRI
jgi:hypothetical protein